MVLDIVVVVSRTEHAVDEEDEEEIDKLLEVVGAVSITELGGCDFEGDATVTEDVDAISSMARLGNTRSSPGHEFKESPWAEHHELEAPPGAELQMVPGCGPALQSGGLSRGHYWLLNLGLALPNWSSEKSKGILLLLSQKNKN
ncbi:hypothetical protein TNCV_359291 [Trichonephila clavipes]|nr:hypothetical protein TNCV_359291 [Trichonephila clavipes]